MSKETENKKGIGTGGKIAIGCSIAAVVGIILIIGFAIFLGFFTFAKTVEEVETSIETSEEHEEERQKQIFENPYVIGDSVIWGNATWTVTDAKDIGSKVKSKYGQYGDDCVTQSGTFIKVTIDIKNNSQDILTVHDIYLYDEQKRRFEATSEHYSCFEEDIYTRDNVNPGITRTFTLIYEVPTDAQGLRIRVCDFEDSYSEEYRYISLGF